MLLHHFHSIFFLYLLFLFLDWVTPDLLEIFQKNEIIKNGLKNSKCTAAMHMMQSDPKEARKRFEGDVEVDTFLREFGRVMSGHFEKLGSEKDSVASSGEKNATNDKKKSVPLISECVSSSGNRGQNKNKIIENNRSLELGDAKAVNSSSTHGITSSSSYGILQAEAIERHRSGVAFFSC